MNFKNKTICSNDQTWLSTLQDEYRWLGFETLLTGGTLKVFSLRRTHEPTVRDFNKPGKPYKSKAQIRLDKLKERHERQD